MENTEVEITMAEGKKVKLSSQRVKIDDLIEKAIKIAKRLQDNNYKDD